MKKFYKKLTCSITKHSGRNNQGRITVRHKGNGCKKLYRKVNFDLDFSKEGHNYQLIRVEYDPNRSSFIGLVYGYLQKNFDYILLPEGLNTSDFILNSSEPNFKLKPGYRGPIKDFPLGTVLHNISLHPNSSGVLCRSKGSYAKLLQKNLKGKYVRLKLPSGEERLVLESCKATIGSVSLLSKNDRKNAGFSRRKGIRPTVRGVAMNPVDHPHGGGEGRTSGGRCSVSPWGKLTKGKRTVNNKKSFHLIKHRKQI